MNIKTVEISGVTPVVIGNRGDMLYITDRYWWIRNKGDSSIYASLSDDVTAGADGTAEIPAGEVGMLEIDRLHSCIYLLGSGKAEVRTTSEPVCPFKSGAKGGGSLGVVTASGNPVQLDGLQGGVPFNRVEVCGKNLIPRKSFTSIETNGITFISNNDGSITAKGVSTANVFFDFTGIFRIAGGIYCLSGTPSECLNENCYMSIRSNTPPIGEKTNFDELNGSMSVVPHDDAYCIIQIISGVDFGDGVTFYPQLELGTTPTEYEPPITGRDLTVNVSGKNLLPAMSNSVTRNGITYTVNADGTITLNGTAEKADGVDVVTKMPIKAGVYTLSGCPEGGSSTSFALRAGIGTANTLYGRDYGNGLKIAVDTDTILTVTIQNAEIGRVFDNVVFRPQLEIGTVATEYEPYHGAEYTITPDINPYTVPVDITQYDGINVLSIADDSNPIISVSGNKASEQLSTIYRTLDNKPVLLFEGNIPTSSLYGYAEFTVDKEYTALMVVPTCKTSSTYILGVCTVIPMSYIESTEKDFSVTGYPRGTSTSSRVYIKRDGNTIYVRETSTTCDYMTIYGI